MKKLTERQKQVLLMVGEEATDKVIARALNISERTVEAHLRAVFDRLGARSRAEARRLAEECGEI